MERRHCAHQSVTSSMLLFTWCVRCQGWNVVRVAQDHPNAPAASRVSIPERHWLPVEESQPHDLVSLLGRALRDVQEMEQEARSPRG